MTAHWLGIDVGGANLKLATTDGYARSEPFPLWQRPHELTQALRQLLQEAPRTRAVAVTMTGELADCYASKREGVGAIVAAVGEATALPVWFYLTTGSFVVGEAASKRYVQAAASNWHALANWTGRKLGQGEALMVDVGSTTTDIIPLRDGKVIARGATDTERLLARELVYLGAERTPVSMIVESVAYRGQRCPVARELFATMHDVLLLLGLCEESARLDTADGRPATRACAQGRLARCLAACDHEFDRHDAQTMAAEVLQEARDRIASALFAVADSVGLAEPQLVLAGHGHPLLDAGASYPKRSLVDWLPGREPDAVSRCAPAFAVAALASQDDPGGAEASWTSN